MLLDYLSVCMNNAKMKMKVLIFLQYTASTPLDVYLEMRLWDKMAVLVIIFMDICGFSKWIYEYSITTYSIKEFPMFTHDST